MRVKNIAILPNPLWFPEAPLGSANVPLRVYVLFDCSIVFPDGVNPVVTNPGTWLS